MLNARRMQAFALTFLAVLVLGAPAGAVPDKPAEAPLGSKSKVKAVPPAAPPVRLLAGPPAPGADLKACNSCHAPMLADATAHNPAKNGDCAACHIAAPGAAGKCASPVGTAWKLKAEQPALCARCHDVSGAAPPHPVIKVSGCTACHDPHASKNPALTKIAPVEALCAKCHAKFDDAEFIHTAVKQGKCLGCHSPHAGDARPLLLEERSSLCSSCHKLEAFATQHSRHAPVAEGRCLECHDPHRADNKGVTVESGKKLCLSCHDAQKPPKKDAPSARYRIDLTTKKPHKPLATDDCQVCHTPQHGSDQPSLLQKPVAETCFKCHARFEELYKFQHSAARLGRCTGCHDPHSSANQGLLVDKDPRGLCFRCHQDDITMRKWVHAPVLTKGCIACHDAHGGEYRNSFADAEGKGLCLSCHKGVGVTAKKKHLAIERYGCTVCHDPHGANQPKGLVKPVNALCLSCHAAQKDGRHVVSMGHKVEGGPDPHDVKKDFTCVSCHDPHGGPGKGLFRIDADGMGMCAYCHGDKSGKRPELKDLSHVTRPGPGAKAATDAPDPSPVQAPPASPATSPAASAPPPPAPQQTSAGLQK